MTQLLSILLALLLVSALLRIARMPIARIIAISLLAGFSAWAMSAVIIKNGITDISEYQIVAFSITETLFLVWLEYKSVCSDKLRKFSSLYPSVSFLFAIYFLSVAFIRSATGWDFFWVKTTFALCIILLMLVIPITIKKLLRGGLENISYAIELTIVIISILISCRQ